MKKTVLLTLVLILSTAIGQAKADFVFSEPENLGPVVNSTNAQGEFDMSFDGLELYFGSDRPGGIGDWDIWVATRATPDDNWGVPVNLGNTVNGSKDDWAPSISADKLSLYFSSDRPGSRGSTDIWVTTRASVSDPWDEPENLGPIVNSSAYDAKPSLSSDGLSLFFGSTRERIGTPYSTLCYIYVTTRPTMNDPWSSPVRLGPAINPGIEYDSDWPSISEDGLSLFFSRWTSDGAALRVGTRTSVSDSWNRSVSLGLFGVTPSLSPDGTTMYFCSGKYGGYGQYDLLKVSIEPIVDLNGDGIVDAADMCIAVDNWGTDNSLCDIGPMPWGDGVVDVEDLIVIAGHLFEVYPSAETVEVNEENNGGQVEIDLGKLLVVMLESNPSTGYQWELVEINESILKQFGEVEYKSSDTGDPPIVGAGGWEIFRFKAINVGQTTLKLIYHRPWEEAEPLKTFSIQVTVN